MSFRKCAVRSTAENKVYSASMAKRMQMSHSQDGVIQFSMDGTVEVAFHKQPVEMVNVAGLNPNHLGHLELYRVDVPNEAGAGTAFWNPRNKRLIIKMRSAYRDVGKLSAIPVSFQGELHACVLQAHEDGIFTPKKKPSASVGSRGLSQRTKLDA